MFSCRYGVRLSGVLQRVKIQGGQVRVGQTLLLISSFQSVIHNMSHVLGARNAPSSGFDLVGMMLATCGHAKRKRDGHCPNLSHENGGFRMKNLDTDYQSRRYRPGI